MRSTNELTQDQVKALFHYDPDTGVLSWRMQRGRQKAGARAGCRIKLKSAGCRVSIDHVSYAVHHIAWLWMTGERVTEYLVHKNGKVYDNTFSNLEKRPFPGHGTWARTQRPYSCRCDLCNDAAKNRKMKAIARREHGLDNTYMAGCRCELCREAHNQFYREYRSKKGFDYVRGSNLRSTFGITLQDYEGLKAAQQGRCAICGGHETVKHQRGLVNQLVVDHDHTTKKIRGLLCSNCNRAIGLLKEDVVVLHNAAKYLLAHQTPCTKKEVLAQ